MEGEQGAAYRLDLIDDGDVLKVNAAGKKQGQLAIVLVKETDSQVRDHVGTRVGESEAVGGEALRRRHELVQTAKALRHLRPVALELEVDHLHRFCEAEDRLRVEPGEQPHERVEVFLLAEGVGDGDELLEKTSSPLELGLDEDHCRDPVGEVLAEGGQLSHRCQYEGKAAHVDKVDRPHDVAVRVTEKRSRIPGISRSKDVAHEVARL